MNFIKTRTPSTVGFDGKIFKFEYISIFNCSSNNIGTTVSRSNKMQTYDYISCDSCFNSLCGLNPNFGTCGLSNINVSNFVSPRGNGAIFLGNTPKAYKVSLVNLINNTLSSVYFPSCSGPTTNNLTIYANFIKNNITFSFLYLWHDFHLFEKLCVFQNTFPTFIVNFNSVYTFIDSYSDNTTISDILNVEDFTTNLVPHFTILFSPDPIYISACVCHISFNLNYFLSIMIIM